jgi:hypothetical protein
VHHQSRHRVSHHHALIAMMMNDGDTSHFPLLTQTLEVLYWFWCRPLSFWLFSSFLLSSPRSTPRVSLDPFLFFGISTHTSVDPSVTFASFLLLVWVFCQSHSRSLGGETSWLGTSRRQCLCDARVVLWFLSLGKFSSNVNPLMLCSITSRLRPSALVFHITKWQLASIQDTCKDSSGTPPIIWFHLEYSCHVVSSFCVFVYTNRVSFCLFKQQLIVY